MRNFLSGYGVCLFWIALVIQLLMLIANIGDRHNTFTFFERNALGVTQCLGAIIWLLAANGEKE